MTNFAELQVREVHPSLCFLCTAQQHFLDATIGLCDRHLAALRAHPLVRGVEVPS